MWGWPIRLLFGPALALKHFSHCQTRTNTHWLRSREVDGDCKRTGLCVVLKDAAALLSLATGVRVPTAIHGVCRSDT